MNEIGAIAGVTVSQGNSLNNCHFWRNNYAWNANNVLLHNTSCIKIIITVVKSNLKKLMW